MESSSNNNNCKQQANGGASGGNPARPHWRRRDRSATAVYVVHPTQFRDVVQQLTGAPASPAMAGRSHDGGTATATAAASNNAVVRQQHEGGASKDGESSSRQRTLGQMYQECMAWANSDE